jgi:methionyl-tRNA synthetase
MSAGPGAARPSVFGHGFVLHRGEKMSKSLGNVVDPLGLAEAFRRRSAAIIFLLRDVSFPAQDAAYSADAIVDPLKPISANSFG